MVFFFRIPLITYLPIRAINIPYYGAGLASRPVGRKGICDIYGEDF
jgi:hypothetical protein